MTLRIALNDYAGHPFQIQLARELADRGHEVTFLYCSSNLTPHGDLSADRSRLEVIGVSTGATFDKYAVGKRIVHEIRYGIASARLQRRRGCMVVLSSNVPVLALLVMRCLAPSVRQVLWLQDIQAGLVGMALQGRARRLAHLFSLLERRVVSGADAVVAIAPSMINHLAAWGLAADTTTVIENWAPLDELPQRPRDNEWSRRHGLDDKFVFLYSGTLGIKHRPELLVQLCREFADVDDVRIVAVSQGRGADWLADEKERCGLNNLLLLPYQPFADLPEVLASADVLLAILEQEAGSFSIPSKVLSYLCAGRPILASLPPENSSAELIADRARAGLVSTTDTDFLLGARQLRQSAELRRSCGVSGREYAEKAFDIDRIAQQFIEILDPPEHRSPARARQGVAS